MTIWGRDKRAAEIKSVGEKLWSSTFQKSRKCCLDLKSGVGETRRERF